MPQERRMAPGDEQYRCAVCGQWHVVPGLARQCEAKHGHA